MKASLSLLISYIFLCVLGTIACAALFMVSHSLYSFVAGKPLPIISETLFLRGVLFSAPAVFATSLVLLVLRIIRWRNVGAFGHILSFVFYSILCVVFWVFALPRLIAYESDTLMQFETRTDLTPVTAGYFRNQDDGILYFSRVLPSGKADGIFINTSPSPSFISELSDYPSNTASDYPYSDVIVRDAVRPPLLAQRPILVYQMLLSAARDAKLGGTWSWLLFASMGLSLFALYFLKSVSDWKLFSTAFVVLGAILVIFVNYASFSGKIPAIVFDFYARLPEFVSKNPISLCFNVVFSGILTIFGVISTIFAIKNRKIGKEGGEE